MYYLAKFLQAAGLTIILIDFIRRFPNLMNMRVLGAGIAVFTFGWLLERLNIGRRK